MTIKSRHRLTGIYNKVRFILEDVPATRNSDKLLYLKYLERTFGHDIICKPLATVMMRNDIPTIESVGRMRRLVQARYPELEADKEIEEQRRSLENDYRDIGAL